MKNYQELKKERAEKYDKAITKNGVFFAFSDKQFQEGKAQNPLQEGEKYVSMGMGGYIRKSCVDSYIADMKAIEKWFKAENAKIKADKLEREKAILYELCNYETFYTGDILNAFVVLKKQGYTRSQVLDVYKKNYKSQNI